MNQAALVGGRSLISLKTGCSNLSNAGLRSRTTCLRTLRLWPRTSVTPGPLRVEAAMKILADAEEALKEVERDANKLQSRELRQLIQECIHKQREAIKALRRFYN